MRPSPGDLLQEVEELVSTISSGSDASSIREIAQQVVERLGKRLGLIGARTYRRDGGDYVLTSALPQRTDLQGFRVPASYPPIDRLLEERFLYMRRDDPRLDKDIEKFLGVDEFAAIWIDSDRCDCIVAFDVADGRAREEIRYALSILRYSIQHRLREEWLDDVLREARRVQASMLPRRTPVYGDFDLAGRTVPMERLGGDFYDYIPISPQILGLAIADVTGHGLPAALQTRDVYTGLRMGLARDLKIVRTMERLNRIVSRSTLTSRFVSLFYGELELNGLFIYVNAGHNAPFHVSAAGEATALTAGGPVLGPIPDATYARGFVELEPGDTLVLYTDGIVEAEGKRDGDESELYGVERLLDVVRGQPKASAEAIVNAVFDDVKAFSTSPLPNDDRTVVVLKKPA